MKEFFFSNYYYISLVLQAICALHCLKKGTQQKWIWLIVFLPFIGCIAYLYTEVFTKKSSYQVYNNKKTFSLFSNDVKKLEEALKFSDTFKNRVALADAYLNNNQIDKAIIVYEDSLQGNFNNDEYVTAQLIACYYQKKEFDKLVQLAQTIYQKPQFLRSTSHTYYAIALGKVGKNEEAEKEFNKLNGKFSYFEARYNYALFLNDNNRKQDAKNVLQNILNDANMMNRAERNNVSNWISLSKQLQNNL